MSKITRKSPGPRNLDRKVRSIERKAHPETKAEEQEENDDVSKKKGKKNSWVVETMDSTELNGTTSDNPVEGGEKNYCNVCQIKFIDEQSFKGHLLGKKHLKSTKFYEQHEASLRTVYVSNLPKYISRSHFRNFFSQFGQIISFSQWPHNGRIEYVNKESAEILLNNSIYITDRFGGQTNIVANRKQYTTKFDLKTNQEANERNELSFECIKEVLETDVPFEEQLPVFIDKIRLSDEEVRTRYENIATTLEEVFRPIFPNCKAYRFGSSVTGLGFKKCDLDLFLNIGEPINENENATQGWTPPRIFREAKALMFRRGNIFSQIVPIPKAKTPIIKFCHTSTNIYCDMSFKNGLGVRNSELIKHYLTYDPRLKPMLIVIKYWTKTLMLSGTGKISHYALTMLVLFYLQQEPTRLVPPVSVLQQKLPDVLIHGWQTNFDSNHSFFNSNSNSDFKSIQELLLGFFEFYASYDFGSNVICPLDGLSHPKTLFKDTASLPEAMHRYKENVLERGFPPINVGRPMCLQDPIELNRNVMECCFHSLQEEFQNSCKSAADLCLAVIQQKEASSSLLLNLFATAPPKKKELIIQVIIPGNYIGVALPTDFDSRTDIVDREQFKLNCWFQLATELVKDLLTKVFKFQVQILSPDKEMKQQKVEVDSDVHSQGNEKVVLHCVGHARVWYRRNNHRFIFDPTLTCLEKEALITDTLIEASKKSGEYNPGNLKIEIMCVIEKKPKPVHLCVTMTNVNSTKSIFRDMANFARARIPTIIDKTLAHMAQYKNR